MSFEDFLESKIVKREPRVFTSSATIPNTYHVVVNNDEEQLRKRENYYNEYMQQLSAQKQEAYKYLQYVSVKDRVKNIPSLYDKYV